VWPAAKREQQIVANVGAVLVNGSSDARHATRYAGRQAWNACGLSVASDSR
jgi:hypothetical protein